MTWTFDVTNLAGDVAQVRTRVGDTDTTDQLITDEEIQFFVDQEPNGDVTLAAAAVADAIAAKFARKASFSTGDMSVGAERFKYYKELAQQLRDQPALDAAHRATIYVGGRIRSEKDTLADNSSLEQPSFSRGMDDNFRVGVARVFPPSDTEKL